VNVWFGAGAASAVAAQLALIDYPQADVLYIDPGEEHPDQPRFVADCAEWFGRDVTVLRSEKYAGPAEVFEARGYIVGVAGAPCTTELKKKVREAYQRPDDLHIFGYTSEEADRLAQFREHEPGLAISAPLIDHDLTKSDCLSTIVGAGIELPTMYKLGYRNNNCVGCVKGGMGYWNMIRRDFPDVFWGRAKLERDIGHAICSEEIPGSTTREKRPVWLDELDPERGSILTDPDMTCSLNCAAVEVAIAGRTR
jgi:3'-phosphoadenosine 5'-phosphosulfate sulfotransferase (PAPS reductase)/FAD synthetase